MELEMSQVNAQRPARRSASTEVGKAAERVTLAERQRERHSSWLRIAARRRLEGGRAAARTR
jgi:hypothetical protein